MPEMPEEPAPQHANTDDGAAGQNTPGSQQAPSPPASPPESHAPMLDVHPVHGPVTSWREFFTHILIIAIGLCLALALQETVEYLHHRYELTETRGALRLEREENKKTFAAQTVAWRWGVAELENNLMVLEYLAQHPGTPQEQLPGILKWDFGGLEYSSAVWDAARQSGVAALMPREEIEANNDLYTMLQREFDVVLEAARAIMDAQRYTYIDSDPSHLTAHEVAAEIELTENALTKQLLYGTLMRNLGDEYSDFPPTVTREELKNVGHPPEGTSVALLSAARALTLERLKAKGYELDRKEREAPAVPVR